MCLLEEARKSPSGEDRNCLSVEGRNCLLVEDRNCLSVVRTEVSDLEACGDVLVVEIEVLEDRKLVLVVGHKNLLEVHMYLLEEGRKNPLGEGRKSLLGEGRKSLLVEGRKNLLEVDRKNL